MRTFDYPSMFLALGAVLSMTSACGGGGHASSSGSGGHAATSSSSGSGNTTAGSGGGGGAPGGACASGNAPGTYFLSPTGSDSGTGDASQPWLTFDHSLRALKAGDTLCVHGGTYVERVQLGAVGAGTAAAPVRVLAVPGERPIIEGLFWIKGADSWQVRGINVTWGASNTHDEHMVKFTDGAGWEFTDAEVWGAESFAAILVAGSPSSWALRRLYVHDTADMAVTGHSVNQDHLIYVNAGTGGGVIERSVLVNSPNGRGVKIGPSSCGAGATANVVVRYTTMVDNLGPSNLQFSCESHDNRAERNLLVHSLMGRTNITAFSLTGANNVAADNLGWDSAGVVEGGTGIVDSGGNVMRDPLFVNAGMRDFHVMDPVASMYGAYAP